MQGALPCRFKQEHLMLLRSGCRISSLQALAPIKTSKLSKDCRSFPFVANISGVELGKNWRMRTEVFAKETP
jgi:hypothetical protein